MGLKETINSDLKESLKKQETGKVSVLRMLNAAIQKKEIDMRGKGEGELSDEGVISVLQSEAKKRADAIELYTQGGREELASGEKDELDIIKSYLPEEASEEDIAKYVDELIASGEKEFGPLMKNVLDKFKGRTDGKIVGKIVKEKIG